MKAKVLLQSAVPAMMVLVAAWNERPPADADAEVRVWAAPKEEPYWREDGAGPYAPAWPTMAVIRKYAPMASGADRRAAMWDSTLFLMAMPGLQESNAVALLADGARFAAPCRSDGRGAWVRFAPPPELPCFVLAHDSGGTAGEIVCVFRHAVSYDSPHRGDDVFQDHTFSEALAVLSRLPVLMGDIDGNGRIALLVGSEETNSSGAPETPQRYRVFQWDTEMRSFRVVREIDAADAMSRNGLSPF